MRADLAVVAFKSGQTAADVSAGSVVRKVSEDGQVVKRLIGTLQASGSVLARNRLFHSPTTKKPNQNQTKMHQIHRINSMIK